jgi:hypothetical protein
MSGDRLGGGHGGAAAYPGNGDGGVARSDERGRKRNGGFRHGLLGQHCRGRAAAVGTRTRRVQTAPIWCGARASTGAWQPRGDAVLIGRPGAGSGG